MGLKELKNALDLEHRQVLEEYKTILLLLLGLGTGTIISGAILVGQWAMLFTILVSAYVVWIFWAKPKRKELVEIRAKIRLLKSQAV